MNRADVLDELRSQIGVLADQSANNIQAVYPHVCNLLVQEVVDYASVLIYLVKDFHFQKCFFAGENNFADQYAFGTGQLSIAAVRGSVVHERKNKTSSVYLPFYLGHHLVGVMVVQSEVKARFADDDITFFSEIVSLFESRIKKGKL